MGMEQTIHDRNGQERGVMVRTSIAQLLVAVIGPLPLPPTHANTNTDDACAHVVVCSAHQQYS